MGEDASGAFDRKPPKALRHGFGNGGRIGATSGGIGYSQAVQDLQRAQTRRDIVREDGGKRQGDQGRGLPSGVLIRNPPAPAPNPGPGILSSLMRNVGPLVLRGGIILPLIFLQGDTPRQQPDRIRKFNVDLMSPEEQGELFQRVRLGQGDANDHDLVRQFMEQYGKGFEEEFGIQIHHYVSDKITDWGSDKGKLVLEMKDILKHYCLDIQGAWNKDVYSTEYHSGNHSLAYHRFVLENMKQAQMEAQGNTELFLKLFDEYVRGEVRRNPQMLRWNWKNK
jgi:hypothetical protein